jgi:hypothetical protein
LKVLINEDPNRQCWQLQEMMVHKLNVCLSTTQIGIAVNTGVKEHGLGYSHKLKQFVAGEKDHESRVAFLKYISLLLPAWDENWHKVVFFDGNASLPPRSDSLYQPLIGRTAIKRLLAP